MRIGEQYLTSGKIKKWLDESELQYEQETDGSTINIRLGFQNESGEPDCIAAISFDGDAVVSIVEYDLEIPRETMPEVLWFLNLLNNEETCCRMVVDSERQTVCNVISMTAMRLEHDFDSAIGDILIYPLDVFERYGEAIRQVARGNIGAQEAFELCCKEEEIQ
mgnify:CR=1 FL=1